MPIKSNIHFLLVNYIQEVYMCVSIFYIKPSSGFKFHNYPSSRCSHSVDTLSDSVRSFLCTLVITIKMYTLISVFLLCEEEAN